MRDIFQSAEFQDKMMDNKWLGNKTKQGYYKKVKDDKGKNVKLCSRLEDDGICARPASRNSNPFPPPRKRWKTLPTTMKMVFNGTIRPVNISREYLCNNFHLFRQPDSARSAIPSLDIDNAMKWGYNHQLGPFEILGCRRR